MEISNMYLILFMVHGKIYEECDVKSEDNMLFFRMRLNFLKYFSFFNIDFPVKTVKINCAIVRMTRNIVFVMVVLNILS